MSNGSSSSYVGACRKDIPYPSVSSESVPSLIDNLVTALYGTITKSVINRRVVWNIPCDPSNTAIVSPALPRLAGEGLLCYIIRVFEAFISGGTEVFSPFLNWTFTGNGSTTTYSLPNATALLSAAYLVYIDGVVQAPVNYTIASGNPLTIVFSTAIPNGSQVVIVCMGSASQGTLDGVTINGATINTATINNLTATGTLALPVGSVTSAMILNGTIINEDINAAAAIATSKLAPVTATGSTTARTLENRFADVVNVKDFGATGNGVADDTAAIQAAVNNGGEVFFPKGTYLVSGITIPSNTKLQGVGRSSVISFSQAGTVGITISGRNEVDVFDLCFQDGATRTTDSILVYNSSNITFFHCNWLQSGGQYISIHIKSCDKVILQDCTAFSNGNVGYACLVDGDTTRSNNITFDALNTYGYYNGVQVRWANVVHTVDSYFTNAGGAGFSVNPSNARSIYGLTINEIVSKVVFENTSFQSNSGAGFELVNNGTINNVALSNSCSLTNNGDSSSNSSGFYVSNSNASLISCSAQINNNWASGVMLERGTNISFIGALISNNARGGMGNGVDIISGVTYVTFNGCSISCQTGPPTSGQNYGINSTANAKFVIIANQFVGGANWYNFPAGGTVQAAYNQ
jgi:hypothetical protein